MQQNQELAYLIKLKAQLIKNELKHYLISIAADKIDINDPVVEDFLIGAVTSGYLIGRQSKNGTQSV